MNPTTHFLCVLGKKEFYYFPIKSYAVRSSKNNVIRATTVSGREITKFSIKYFNAANALYLEIQTVSANKQWPVLQKLPYHRRRTPKGCFCRYF